MLILKLFLRDFRFGAGASSCRVTGLALLLGALAGCTGLPVVPEAPETFVLTGKVGVREADESFSANLLWHQKGEAFEIDLWGPLGQGRVKLVKKDGEISLESAKGVLAQGDPEQVMQTHLGWSLPLDVLPAWVQGAPFPDLPVSGLSEDASGNVSGFEQAGWAVVLERYRNVPVGPEAAATERALPRRVTATREDARVRLVISEWRL